MQPLHILRNSVIRDEVTGNRPPTVVAPLMRFVLVLACLMTALVTDLTSAAPAASSNLLISAANSAGASTSVSKGGVPQCAILMVNGTSNSSNPSAAELKTWLDTITGGSFSIQKYSASAATGIILGTTAEFPDQALQYNVNQNTVGMEGYRIVTDGSKIWILAQSTLGIEHGVFRLLESVGCRWLMPDPVWYNIPKKTDLSIGLNITEKPAYDYTRIWYGWGGQPGDIDGWHKRNRMPHGINPNCGEMWETVISQAEFAAHPDWAALVNGKRVNWQLCVSNPDLQQHFIDQVISQFVSDPSLTMASVEPADGDGFCECKNCKAIGQGTPSDQACFLANLTARAVSKRFPGQNKWVGLYAYAYHSAPPNYPLSGPCPNSVDSKGRLAFTGFEPNVYIQITNGFNFSGLSNDILLSILRNQGLKASGTYEYYSYLGGDKPIEEATHYYEIASMMRHYNGDLGINSMDCESQCNWGPNGPGYWITSRLAWNPNLLAADLIRDFCSAFGKAGVPMRRFYDRLADGIGFSSLMIKLSLEDLNKAYSLEGNPAEVARLDRIAMYLHDQRLQYEHMMAVSTHQPQSVLNDIDHRWVVWLRRIWNTLMCDSKIDLYDEPISSVMFTPNDPAGGQPSAAKSWKTERTDLPSSSEMISILSDDRSFFSSVPAVEPYLWGYTKNLVTVGSYRPDLVRQWGTVPRQVAYMEDSTYLFRGYANEAITITVSPYGGQSGGHNMNWQTWSIYRYDPATDTQTLVAEGTYSCKSGDTSYINVTLPAESLYILDPGTYFWSAASCTFSPTRPNVMLATPGKFRQWMDLADIYFFVPGGTKGFCINATDGGGATMLTLSTSDRQTVFSQPYLGGQASFVVAVPAGKDGQIWCLHYNGLRDQYDLQGVPPYFACSPAELMVPEECIGVVASSQQVNTKENTIINGQLKATSPLNKPLAFSLLDGSGTEAGEVATSMGTLKLTDAATGGFRYTPNTNAWGTDTIYFVASNGAITSLPAVLTVSIAAVGHSPAPTAYNTTLTTKAGQSARGQFSITDPTNDAVTFRILQNGTRGVATLVNAATGTFIYSPKASLMGTDTIRFVANDGVGDSNQGKVTITITR